MAVTLWGLAGSTYTTSARLALLEKGIVYRFEAIDPFAPDLPPDWYRDLQPFGRVPALEHDGFRLHETVAILRYVDEAFPGLSLQPDTAAGRARMQQLISIVDAEAYRPLVWGLYVELIEKPKHGETSDAAKIAESKEQGARALAAIVRLHQGPWLLGRDLCLADLHLAPVIAYTLKTPEGQALMEQQPGLTDWWQNCRARAGWLDLLPL